MADLKPEPIEVSENVAKAPRRHILLRLFGIKVLGWVRLVLLCILVGFLVMAAEFDPTSPDVDATAALASFANSAVQAMGWAVTHFWKPALAGATIVMPIWVLWRMATLPFRK